MKTYAQLLAELGKIENTSSDRVMLLVENGIPHVEAVIMNEMFETVVKGVQKVIGSGVDLMAEHLRLNALMFIMRGVISNLDQLEDVLITQTALAMEQCGGLIVVAGGITPGCDCPVCTAARANEAMHQNDTRH